MIQGLDKIRDCMVEMLAAGAVVSNFLRLLEDQATAEGVERDLAVILAAVADCLHRCDVDGQQFIREVGKAAAEQARERIREVQEAGEVLEGIVKHLLENDPELRQQLELIEQLKGWRENWRWN